MPTPLPPFSRLTHTFPHPTSQPTKPRHRLGLPKGATLIDAVALGISRRKLATTALLEVTWSGVKVEAKPPHFPLAKFSCGFWLSSTNKYTHQPIHTSVHPLLVHCLSVCLSSKHQVKRALEAQTDYPVMVAVDEYSEW